MTDDDVQHCLDLLEASRDLDPDDPRFLALENAAAHLRKQAKKKRRAQRRRETRQRDLARQDGTELARSRGKHGRVEPLERQRTCYVCKQPYRQLHGFYHLLCPVCGDANQARRDATLDLTGRSALVTGGRIKIGYATALRLLRSGARVRVTTRYPHDAVERYTAEPDSADWSERLTVEGLDFRRLGDVLQAIEQWSTEPLDVLINNAAQTVWRPPEAAADVEAPARRTAIAVTHWSPPAERSATTALDRQRINSWVMRLEQVPPIEMVEATVVNAIVPFLLCSGLHPAMLRSPHPDRYVVNVAALEGQFTRANKLARHPHTNMAKAALAMLTRTSAEGWAEQGIYMVSVDPGWVSHEGPDAVVRRAEERGFHPPLDAEDAAARLVDPIARGLAGQPVYGVLLKDYAEAPW